MKKINQVILSLFILIGLVVVLVVKDFVSINYDTTEERLRVDHFKMITKQNYPVCKLWSSLNEKLLKDESNSAEMTQHYQSLLQNNEMYCGSVRHGLGVLRKK